MKHTSLLFVFLLGVTTVLQAQGNWSLRGTVIKMRMVDCVPQGGFMATMSGVPVLAGITCPEYTVMSDKVVYVVVGRRTEQFIPLSENTNFLVRKNELVILSNDEKTKSRFVIQQMTLRADWEREKARKELETRLMERRANYELPNPPHSTVVSANAR